MFTQLLPNTKIQCKQTESRISQRATWLLNKRSIFSYLHVSSCKSDKEASQDIGADYTQGVSHRLVTVAATLHTRARIHTPAITAVSVHPRTLAMSALIKPALGPADPWQGSESANKWPQATRSRGSGWPKQMPAAFFFACQLCPPHPDPLPCPTGRPASIMSDGGGPRRKVPPPQAQV